MGEFCFNASLADSQMQTQKNPTAKNKAAKPKLNKSDSTSDILNNTQY